MYLSLPLSHILSLPPSLPLSIFQANTPVLDSTLTTSPPSHLSLSSTSSAPQPNALTLTTPGGHVSRMLSKFQSSSSTSSQNQNDENQAQTAWEQNADKQEWAESERDWRMDSFDDYEGDESYVWRLNLDKINY